MWISFIDTALTLISSCFVSASQSGSAAYSAAAFSAACLFHVGLHFLTTRGSIGERFFLILSYAAFFTACCAVTRYVDAFTLPKIGWLYLLVYGVSLSVMLWIFLGKLLPVFRQSAGYIGKAWGVLSGLMALFMLELMTWFVFPSHITDFTLEQAVGLPGLVVLMFVAYGVIFVCIRDIAAAERARHDLRHHNLALLALAEQGNTAELVRYLRSMTEVEHAAETVWRENDTLSSVLSVYAAKAAAAGIKTDVLAQAERDLAIPPDELVTVAVNLFENAIHGAAVSGAPKPYVTARVHRKSDKLVIRMENACSPQLDYPDGFPSEKYGAERFLAVYWGAGTYTRVACSTATFPAGLIGALNSAPDSAPEELLPLAKTAIDSFVGDAPQFDDITMLCLKVRENPL